MKILIKIFIPLFLIFLFFVYYKTRIKKSTRINENYILEYVREYETYFIDDDFSDTFLHHYGYVSLSHLYVAEDAIYIIEDGFKIGSCYRKIDKNKLYSVELKGTDSVEINKKKIKVEQIKFSSAYWYLIFH